MSRKPATPTTRRPPTPGTEPGGADARHQTLESIRASVAPDLGALLDQLIATHHEWLKAVGAHRQSVRGADVPGMQDALNAQHRCATRVAALEENRREIVARAARLPELAPSPARPRSGPLTLGEIAAAAPAEFREGLVERAAHLRSLIAELRRANSTLHAASASLLAHTEGLMRHVARRLSAAGTYGRRGFVEPAPGLACAVDLVH